MRELLALGGEHCPCCDYHLRHLTGTICPKCGETLALHVEMEYANIIAYRIGQAGLIGAVAFTVLLIPSIMMGMMFSSNVTDAMTVLLGAMLVTPTLLLSSWIRLRRRIQRLNAPFLVFQVGVCWLVQILTFFALAIIVTSLHG